MLRNLRDWRRQRVLDRSPLDPQRWEAVVASFPFLRALDRDEGEKLRRWVTLFLREKDMHGAAGLALDDGMRYAIAAQACILILELDLEYFRGWAEVVVYPTSSLRRATMLMRLASSTPIAKRSRAKPGSAGRLFCRGQTRAPGEYRDGVNVVIHEFAHKLDMLNGEADGYPPLHRGMTRKAWLEAFETAYRDFCDRVDAGEEMPIDPYASEHPGEFFAVMTEAFFEIPRVLQGAYPEVYRQLSLFYRQDPLLRVARATRRAGMPA